MCYIENSEYINVTFTEIDNCNFFVDFGINKLATNSLRIDLISPLKYKVKIYGVLTNSNDIVLINKKINLFSLSKSNKPHLISSTFTDNNGFYVFENIPLRSNYYLIELDDSKKKFCEIHFNNKDKKLSYSFKLKNQN